MLKLIRNRIKILVLSYFINLCIAIYVSIFYSYYSQIRIRWDLFIILLATVNCFQVPYNVAFADIEETNTNRVVFKVKFWQNSPFLTKRARFFSRHLCDLLFKLLIYYNLVSFRAFNVKINIRYFNTEFNPQCQCIGLDIFNGFIDFFFMLDVVINFRTSYINELTGTEILDTKKIALKYLKTRFWVDILASVPLDFFSYALSNSKSNTFLLQMLGLLKLVRVLRLSRLITYLNFKNDIKMTFKLIKLVFFLVLYLHCLGCVWYFIVKQDKDWIPPLDYVFITTDLWEKSSFYKYTMSVYHAVLMLGGNDVGPRGNLQISFVTLMLLMAAIINANIFGNIAVLIQSLNRKASNFQEKMEYASETMKNLRIPEGIQDEVKSYLTYTQSTLDHQKDLDLFLNMLSPSLKHEVSVHIFHDTISMNDCFKENAEVVQSILNDLKINLLLPEDKIIRQDDVADCMYFLAKGECDVYVTDENQMEKFTKALKGGSYFGEVALLKKCKRTASVISKNYSIFQNFSDRFF